MRKLEGKLFLPHQNNIGDQNKTKQKKRRGGGEWGRCGNWGQVDLFWDSRKLFFFKHFWGMTLLFLGYRVVSKGWWVKDDRKTCVCGGLKR